MFQKWVLIWLLKKSFIIANVCHYFSLKSFQNKMTHFRRNIYGLYYFMIQKAHFMTYPGNALHYNSLKQYVTLFVVLITINKPWMSASVSHKYCNNCLIVNVLTSAKWQLLNIGNLLIFMLFGILPAIYIGLGFNLLTGCLVTLVNTGVDYLGYLVIQLI